MLTLFRGIRWDETFEYAKAITGRTPYPEGHPFLRFSREALSLQTYASAWLVGLGGGPAIVCGLRNYLYLLATTVPVFLITTALSRRSIVGHAAALLFLLGILHEFDGAYPLSAWPALGSIGHIGMGYALFILALFALGLRAPAFFLLGLMPAFHLGQAPILGILAAGYGMYLVRRRNTQSLARGLRFFLVGLTLAGIFIWNCR